MCIVASEKEGGVDALGTKIAIERAKGQDSFFFPYIAYLPTVTIALAPSHPYFITSISNSSLHYYFNYYHPNVIALVLQFPYYPLGCRRPCIVV